MKKKIALLLAAAIAVGTIAGCGSQSAGSGEAESNSAAGIAEDGTADPRFKYEEPVTLTSYFEISPAIMGDFKQEDMLNSVYYTTVSYTHLHGG